MEQSIIGQSQPPFTNLWNAVHSVTALPALLPGAFSREQLPRPQMLSEPPGQELWLEQDYGIVLMCTLLLGWKTAKSI